jgi:hypothetical protein
VAPESAGLPCERRSRARAIRATEARFECSALPHCACSTDRATAGSSRPQSRSAIASSSVFRAHGVRIDVTDG